MRHGEEQRVLHAIRLLHCAACSCMETYLWHPGSPDTCSMAAHRQALFTNIRDTWHCMENF
jgi:hypothetical protein